MKNLCFIRILALVLAICLLAGLCACGKKNKQSLPELTFDFPPAEPNPYHFSPLPSEELYYSLDSAEAVRKLTSQPTDYPYSDLYQMDMVHSRLDFDASVENHQYCALDSSNQLTAAHLAQLVKTNNDAFMADKPFGYEAMEEEDILKVCNFLVDIVDRMKKSHPDLDWPRMYCKLGNLKILFKTGMLSYAQVNQDMVLCLSGVSANIANVLEGENSYSRITIHEIMHIFQMGCSCERIENCSRRAGICCYYDDFTLNFADWTWMVEGSAERNMSTLTGTDSITYQYKVDYLCSMTMSVLLRENVQADTIENLCFYDDPELLFQAFGCETEVQRDELLKFMITMQILQMQPEAFYYEYEKQTGIDLKADEETLNQFSYSLKPAVCITLAKEFYENLTDYMLKNYISANDLFFLMNLFEGHLNQHLDYANADKKVYNQPYFDFYQQLWETFLTGLEANNPELDIRSLYAEYSILSEGKYNLNGQWSALPEEKREFMLERAQWQGDFNELGVTVP